MCVSCIMRLMPLDHATLMHAFRELMSMMNDLIISMTPARSYSANCTFNRTEHPDHDIKIDMAMLKVTPL